MTLDPTTIGLVFVLLMTVIGMLLLMSWALNRQIRALAWWGATFLLIAGGVGLANLGRGTPSGLLLSNGMIAIAYGSLFIGCRIFNARAANTPLALAGVVSWFLAWPLISDVYEYRLALMSLVICGYTSLSARELWCNARIRLRSQVLAVFLLCAGVVFHLIRALIGFLHTSVPWVDALGNRWSPQLALALLVYALSVGFVFLSMAKERTEGELRRAAKQLEGAKHAAEQASQAKTEFLASMSHEIRTPLNGVLGSTDLLLQDKDLTMDQRRNAERIQTSGSALLAVVSDILDFSKIEAGAIELDPRPFSPISLLTESTAIVRAVAAKKQLAVRIPATEMDPNRVVGDEPRLRQILLNLLNNAVKFTPAGHVEVALEHERMSATHDRLRFSVSDTGIGIPESKRERLFQRFSQVDGSTSRQYGGTGLGLAISRQLVELMGGEIGVDSEPGRGSTFWFTVTLPRVDSNASAARASSDAIDQHRLSGRILLAEDVDINQEIAKAVLEKAGYEVDVVPDGAAAVKAVQTGVYDIVLMDVQMPVMDGIAATRSIRALAGPVASVPVIAMTANVFAEQIASFRDAGMNDHIGKPFQRDELFAIIARWLPRKPAAKKQST